jgi:molybdopterin converting factor small subunit
MQLEERLDSVSVTVTAFGLWQMILGTRKLQVEIKGRRLRDLINALNEIALGRLEEEVLDAGHLDEKFKIFVNGKASDLNTTIADADDVLLFSVIDGG